MQCNDLDTPTMFGVFLTVRSLTERLAPAPIQHGGIQSLAVSCLPPNQFILSDNMGNIFGSHSGSMAENFKKNQDFITEMNKIKMERHIQMQNQMRERQTAMQIAHDRELSLWAVAFYATFVPFLYVAWKRTKNYAYLAPIVPMSFVMAYQVDQGYGNKIERVRNEAEMIMQFESDILDLPCGLPTASSIDQGRIAEEEQKRLHPAVPSI